MSPGSVTALTGCLWFRCTSVTCAFRLPDCKCLSSQHASIVAGCCAFRDQQCGNCQDRHPTCLASNVLGYEHGFNRRVVATRRRSRVSVCFMRPGAEHGTRNGGNVRMCKASGLAIKTLVSRLWWSDFCSNKGMQMVSILHCISSLTGGKVSRNERDDHGISSISCWQFLP